MRGPEAASHTAGASALSSIPPTAGPAWNILGWGPARTSAVPAFSWQQSPPPLAGWALQLARPLAAMSRPRSQSREGIHTLGAPPFRPRGTGHMLGPACPPEHALGGQLAAHTALFPPTQCGAHSTRSILTLQVGNSSGQRVKCTQKKGRTRSSRSGSSALSAPGRPRPGAEAAARSLKKEDTEAHGMHAYV